MNQINNQIKQRDSMTKQVVMLDLQRKGFIVHETKHPQPPYDFFITKNFFKISGYRIKTKTISILKNGYSYHKPKTLEFDILALHCHQDGQDKVVYFFKNELPPEFQKEEYVSSVVLK